MRKIRPDVRLRLDQPRDDADQERGEARGWCNDVALADYKWARNRANRSG
jgi:hypothetical protein